MRKSSLLKRSISEFCVDGILITDIANVRYLSGFTGSSGFLIITKNRPIFVTDFRYQEQAKKEVKSFKIIIQNVELTECIKKLASKYRIQKLGFEAHSISYQTYKKLLRDNIKLRALFDTVEALRLIKSREELSCIKTAIRRAENAFKKLRRFIKVGVTEHELAIKLEGLLREEGCKNVPFGVIVAAGLRSALPHAQPTNKALKRGDFVLFDWGGECDGYYSDMTRTVAIKGRYLQKHKELYSIVLNAQERALKAAQPGTKAALIDAAARDFIAAQGYKKHFGHGTGHGIGLAVHERPVISWQSKDTAEEGMVFTIEPGIYVPGFGGVRIEDVVHIKKNGLAVLTTLPRNLKVL
ncbi:MAG: aminopeptidase P family protein [Thermodesulfovibrionia bacterium]|nr:aminopeptidase P family protein [Thermodesulfovibrionia bacterium]